MVFRAGSPPFEVGFFGVSGHALPLPPGVVIGECRTNNVCYSRNTSIFVFQCIPRADVNADFVRAALQKYERVVCWSLANSPNL